MASVEKVLELLNLLDMKSVMAAVLTTNVQMWTEDFSDKTLADGIAERFDVDELLRRIAADQAKVFDDETLDRVIEFYRSPAGRKFTEYQHEFLPRMIAIGHDYGLELAAADESDSH